MNALRLKKLRYRQRPEAGSRSNTVRRVGVRQRVDAVLTLTNPLLLLFKDASK